MMPTRAPRICGCGYRIASSERCPCERARKADIDRRRPSARARGYSAEWDRAAKAYLQAHPWCVFCAEFGQRTKAAIVDHIKPHRGDPVRFWDQGNWQGLCTGHHNGRKQSMERRAHV